MTINANVMTGAVAVTFGLTLVFWIIPEQTVPAIFASVPSGFYPTFTSTMMIASGIGLTISGFMEPTQQEESISASTTAARFTSALVLLGGAMFATPIFGFVPAGIAICLVTLLLMRENRWALIAAVSVAAPVLVWVGFELILGRPLP